MRTPTLNSIYRTTDTRFIEITRIFMRFSFFFLLIFFRFFSFTLLSVIVVAYTLHSRLNTDGKLANLATSLEGKEKKKHTFIDKTVCAFRS